MNMDEQDYLFQCGVRELIRLRVRHGKDWFIAYIWGKQWDGKRDRYMAAMYQQWLLGNRGEEGMWIDE